MKPANTRSHATPLAQQSLSIQLATSRAIRVREFMIGLIYLLCE
jgi:hypothetical protein